MINLEPVNYEERVSYWMSRDNELNDRARDLIETLCRINPALNDRKDELYVKMKLTLVGLKHSCYLFH